MQGYTAKEIKRKGNKNNHKTKMLAFILVGKATLVNS